jgi:signal transduction histidine kinase
LIDEGMDLLDLAVEEVRDLSFELRPSLLDDLGLVAALRWYTDRFAKRTAIPTTIVTSIPEGVRLKREIETACFRIIQEALTNVARHSRAKSVSINLKTLGSETVLLVRDDGIGFDPYSVNPQPFPIGLGLRGMEERALALGGRLEVKTQPHKGTELRACFPQNGRKRDEWAHESLGHKEGPALAEG